MAKFDVYRGAGEIRLLDCQSDLLPKLNTRFVVPLASPNDAVQIDRRLNPLLDVAGDEMLMLTHLAATVLVRELGPRVASVADQEFVVSNALDMLISGF